MTQVACAKQWANGTYVYHSKSASGIGMQIDAAFRAFAAAVADTAGAEGYPLSVLASHADSVDQYEYGWVWRLGHPTRPTALRYVSYSSYQASSSFDGSAPWCLYDEAVLDVPGTPPYGYFYATAHFKLSRGMSAYTSSASGYQPITDLGGYLVVVYDDKPGREYFSATVMNTRNGTNVDSMQNHTFLVFRSPGRPEWNGALFRSHGSWTLPASVDAFCWNSAGPVLAPLAMTAIATAGTFTGSSVLADQLELLPALSTVPPWTHDSQVQRLMMPSVLWCGITGTASALQKMAVPGRSSTVYQLLRPTNGNVGKSDLWIEVAADATVLPGWSALDDLPWIAPLPGLALNPQPVPLPLLSGPASTPDWVSEWPNSAAGMVGVQQHPIYAQAPGGGGGGGSERPGSGVLWPRGSS